MRGLFSALCSRRIPGTELVNTAIVRVALEAIESLHELHRYHSATIQTTDVVWKRVKWRRPSRIGSPERHEGYVRGVTKVCVLRALLLMMPAAQRTCAFHVNTDKRALSVAPLDRRQPRHRRCVRVIEPYSYRRAAELLVKEMICTRSFGD